jgi:transcription elongation factor Elf1
MMESNLFGDAKLPINCQGCGRSTDIPVPDLETNPKVVCPNCGAVTEINADELKRAREALNRASDKLTEMLKRLSK